MKVGWTMLFLVVNQPDTELDYGLSRAPLKEERLGFVVYFLFLLCSFACSFGTLNVVKSRGAQLEG